MRLKLFNGAVVYHNLSVIAGGYDTETSRVVLIVRGDGDSAGILSLDVAEAHRLAKQIIVGVPSVTRVGEVADDNMGYTDESLAAYAAGIVDQPKRKTA